MSTITSQAPVVLEPTVVPQDAPGQVTKQDPKDAELTQTIATLVTKVGELTAQTSAKEATEVKAENNPAEMPVQFKCPGHTEFFHRYTSREKAKAKASEQVAVCEKKENIQKAIYKLISKSSPEGKNSVYFKGLNKIYNHAIDIISYHTDGCTDCEFNPLHEAKN